MSPLSLIFLLPLVTALVVALIPRQIRFGIRCLALLATLISMLIAVYAFCKFDSHASVPGFQFEERHVWAPAAGISYHVGADGLNLGLILMGTVVLFAAVCVSWRIATREKEYYILLLLMGEGILGAFASLDLFFFYFLHELALVPAFILIGVWGVGKDKNYAAYQITLYLSVGALLVLAGLLAVYLQMPAGARSFDMVDLTAYFKAHPMQAGAGHWIFPLLLFGFGILVSLYPFHTWAPLGYGSAPTGAAMVHAGVLKKFGLYGLLRVALPLMPEEAQRWAYVIAALGLGNVILCGMVAMRQRDLNLLIGNSSVAHVGFAFLGIASMSLIGFTGTVVIMVAHGFLAALTFALSGYLRDELQTLDMDQMGGLLRRLPFIGTVMIMAMMAGCGLPGFAGFFGETLVFFGGWGRSHLVTVLAIWGALIIAGVYMLRAIRSIWHGDKEWTGLSDITGLGKLPYVLLLAGLIIFGCFPRLLTDDVQTSVKPVAMLVEGGATMNAGMLSMEQVGAVMLQFNIRPGSLNPILSLELAVIGLALALLLIDLWTPPQFKHRLGYLAAAGLVVILAGSFCPLCGGAPSVTACGGMFVQDGLALFFKRIFLAAGIFVVLMGVEIRDRIAVGIGEFFTISLIALAGMMFAASANDFVMVYVAMEMMSVSFYVLVSFQRTRAGSLEAGVKYLILSALSAGALVFGIALIFGSSGQTGFAAVAAQGAALAHNKLFCLGALLVLLGLAFKIAAFPMQLWAPDVYQGAPTPVTAFLAIGSKAAGFVLLLRVLFVAAPALSAQWGKLFIWAAALTILYGNLCAIPQRSLKRLLGYSSIANAGYMLLGIAALNATGSAAVLYYMAGYAFTLAAVFIVLCVVARENDDIAVLAGLNRRSPLLALALTLGMISLAGVPPLAGFFGKLMLFQAILEKAAVDRTYLWLTLVAIAGVVMSMYYYFGVIRAVYWSEQGPDMTPLAVSTPLKISAGICIAAMLWLGLCPEAVLSAAAEAVKALRI